MSAVPAGVAGELYIGGDGIARGYHERPELTAESFLPDPFSSDPGTLIYKTGDRARYLANGDIEVLGRSDHQIKLRGFRIELGEIESAIGRLPGIDQHVVVLRHDVPGDQRLVAYIVPEPENAPDIHSLRAALQKTLPDYMLPAKLVELDELPLTPNGKIDRNALPAPGWQPDQEYVAPRNPVEETLTKIWADVLRVEEGSLYPALQRLELRGWITSRWGISENNRRAKFYKLTQNGRKQLDEETASWRRLSSAVDLVLKATPAEGTP